MYRLATVLFGATCLLEALVGPHSLVGKPLSHLLRRYVRLFGQHIGHVVVRIRILLILEKPLVQHVDNLVGKKPVHATPYTPAATAPTSITAVR